MRAVLVTGVQGVGKTTLVKRVAAELQLDSCDYADFMLEVSGLQDKDGLSSLTHARRREIYDSVEEVIVQKFAAGRDPQLLFLLENHLCVVQDGNVMSFPHEDYWRYNLAGICNLSADSQVILKRRQEDVLRKRVVEPLNLVDEHQRQSKGEALAICKHYDVPLLELVNYDLDDAMAKAVTWVAMLREPWK